MTCHSEGRYIPWLGGLLLVGLVVYLLGNGIMTSVRIGLAEEQMAIFEQMREKTAESDAVNVGYLEYVLWYYPSGTKQVSGSPPDRIVERARRSAVREIIALLRSRTGKDFGDDPESWIENLKSSAKVGPAACEEEPSEAGSADRG